MDYKHYFKNVYTPIIIIIILFSVYTRIEGIGYSNFQGDEVQTLDYFYETNKSVIQHLLDQRKGPVQYIINILNVSIFGYRSEFLIRLPYLVFGVLAIFTFYKLSLKLFNEKIAFLTSALMAINGLFIAFSRITQYQSLMFFVIPIGVFMFIDAHKTKNNKKYLYSGLVMSLTLLTHYDTLSTIPFFVSIFIASFIRKSKENFIYNTKLYINANKKLFLDYFKKATIFFSAFILPSLFFYIPFALGSAYENTTSSYLGGRLLGGGFMPRTGHSLKILTLYIPEFYIYFLFVTGVLFIIFLSINLKGFDLKYLRIKTQTVKFIYILLSFLLIFSSLLSLYPIKPRASTLLVLAVSITLSVILLISKNIKTYHAATVIWYLGSYSFYFYIMKDPRTHVYVSFIPLFILSAAGIYKLFRAIKSDLVKHVLTTLLILMMLFISGINYLIFVDKNPEYPWWDKTFMGYDIYKLKRVYHEKIDGVFGFNNYRGWELIASYFESGCLVGDFKSNEKDSITYFYTRKHQEPLVGNFAVNDKINNIIIVRGPNSWDYVEPDGFDGFILLQTIKSYDYNVTFIFGRNEVYPEGKMLCEST